MNSRYPSSGWYDAAKSNPICKILGGSWFSLHLQREAPFGNDSITFRYIPFWSWRYKDYKNIFFWKSDEFFLHLQEGGALWKWLYDLQIYISLSTQGHAVSEYIWLWGSICKTLGGSLVLCTFRSETPFGNDSMTFRYISFWSWCYKDPREIFLLEIGRIV